MGNRNIDNCCAHKRFADKLSLVYSDHDNNNMPELFRIADRRMYDHGFASGYPVKCDARCTSPVGNYTTICRVIDCEHSDDFFGLILEPIVNLNSPNATTLPMLHFFNKTRMFADGETFGLYKYGTALNYECLYDEMRKYDDSIEEYDSRWGAEEDNNRKILNLLMNGTVSVDDIFRCLVTVMKEV